MNNNFISEVLEIANDQASELFMIGGDNYKYYYQDVDDLTAKYANFLTCLGVKPGDRVAAQLEKSPEGFFLYLAVLRMGGIFLPLNTAYTAKEMEYFLCDAEPVVFIASKEKAEENSEAVKKNVRLGVLTLDKCGEGSFTIGAKKQSSAHNVVPRSADDIAIIMYTSGTTGQPKGAMLTHGCLSSNGHALTKAWSFTSSDTLLHTLPIFHAHGLFISTHCVLLSGSKMVFLDKFDASKVVDYLPQCTVMMGVPTFYTRLLSCDEFNKVSTSSMRLFISGSAPLLEEVGQEFYSRTGHVILERYGMTESAIITSNPYIGNRKLGAVGKPIDGVELRVRKESGDLAEVGEVGGVEIRGPAIMKGYWRKPKKTAEEFTDDGWFKTGDIGKQDSEGYLYIVGRQKDLVITGGYNVYPKEVEMVIDAMEGVSESAVIGLPHSDFGEAVTAVVVCENSSQLLQEDVLRECKSQLASYKNPKCIVFYDELPRNAMGKVVKARLRQDLSELYYHK
ncbi:AMP-binding protein [Halomonas sp. GT]|uniref:AMP-binding protein n=1 Tax=Halomonas sp. GT TaxID=1971364 RepID=UPI0009F58309|nr:AMP-binding protein [Halomonas sp. GT]